jgi:MbtH protein
MRQGDREGAVTYRVVVDREEQYSVRPVGRGVPRGWREAGKQGSMMECLAYIEQAWTQLRRPVGGGARVEVA